LEDAAQAAALHGQSARAGSDRLTARGAAGAAPAGAGQPRRACCSELRPPLGRGGWYSVGGGVHHMTDSQLVAIRVWVEFACFTRPEMKVERASHPLPPPSAARGILEAIFWEPQMYYVIDHILVVRKGRWFSFRRNEVSRVINIRDAQAWMAGKNCVAPIE